MEFNYHFLFFNVLVLVLWFKTEAFVEYMRLFKLQKYFYIEDYLEKKNNDFELTYLTYLRQFHDCFIIRLLTCPVCLSCWICLPSLITTLSIEIYSNYVLFMVFLYYLFSKIMR